MELPVLKQSPVRFESATHQYFLGKKELKGITSTLVRRAYPDTYKRPDNYTEEQWREVLANAAAKGSNMHETIELYDEMGAMSDLPELQSYIRIKEENNLTVLATEYVVSDEKDYATAVDKVLMRPDGGIILVDLKRTSVIHYDNVALQLSICKRFFERQNKDLKVSGVYVMWLREDKYEFREVSVWADEILDELIESDIKNVPFDINSVYGDFPQKVYDVQSYIKELEIEVKAKTEKLKLIKEGLCQMMLERGIKKFTTDTIQMTTVTPKPKKSFDSKRFSVEHPDLYEHYIIESEVKPSVRITYK